MASSSTSSINKNFEYDVFLSFRGEDTRRTFVDHLYYALLQRSIHTYKDDKRIEKGKRISDELMKSIEESKFYIIVFSKNYASSSWCLDELVKIMECQKTTEQTAYPIFYDVEPSEVRKQIGVVGEAFAKHVNDKAAGKWREALKAAADLAGWELKNSVDGHEAKFIKKIVEEISLELRSINSSVDGKLVGMETRIKECVSSLEIGCDDVRIIGIKGMGGGGKTTLARAVFDQIAFQFDANSFVDNVREVSKNPLLGLKSLQQQILLDVSNDHHIIVSSIYDGKNKMKRMMRGRKILLVLDDVDHIDQLETLAEAPDWFKKGSRIIITTRDEQVLIAHRVNLIRDVNLLSHEEAICLFSRNAFGRDVPIQGYKELSGQVVSYAAGLPLTIRVLGSFLCGKNELEWIDAIDRLKTIPLKETLEKLELSYISLEEDYKEIFLDVACILKGWKKDDAIRMLESCGFHARNGLRVLEQKCLITISHTSSYEYLSMHDHIEEMGKNIVRRFHPDEPNKHSRLWIGVEIEDVLANDLGTKATKCIKLSTWKLYPEIVMKGFGKLRKLRFLEVHFAWGRVRRDVYSETDGVHLCSDWKFDEVSQYFPNALRYLSCDGYPFRSLPKTFQANNLVGLEMPYSRMIQLWLEGERKVLNKLRFLDLRYSKLKTLDLAQTPNLETLDLIKCFDLVELHISVGCLKLRSIDLSHSSKLRTLDLGHTPNLERLDLQRCDALVELHMPIESLKLKSINLSHSKLRAFDVGRAPNLETLNFIDCHNLVKLHMPIESLKLVSVNLSRSKLRTLDLGLAPNLKRLNLEDCYNLVRLDVPVGCLENLIYLNLSGCWRFKSFLFLKLSLSLDIGSSAELRLVVKPVARDICPFHLDSSLPKYRFICSYKEPVTLTTGNVEKLISVGLCACTNLDSLSGSICGLRCLRKLTLEGSIPEVPKDLNLLECLEELVLLSTNIKHLPNNICLLKHLKSLQLKSCSLLEKLPEDLGQLECLEVLLLNECTYLQDIPNSICNMKRLRYFHVPYCTRIKKLPVELGCLHGLKELDIEGTGINHLPQSIFLLKGLRISAPRWLLQSYGFTSQIQTFGYETFCYI